MLFGKWRPFCLGLNVLAKQYGQEIEKCINSDIDNDADRMHCNEAKSLILAENGN